jgi:pimeloyl-ACP methyl ester carboxylesterase
MPAVSGLRGVVLTSTVTVLSMTNQPIFNQYVHNITVPTLVVWHQDDHCTFSPPAGSAALLPAIPSSTKDSEVFQRPFGRDRPLRRLLGARLCRNRGRRGQGDRRLHQGHEVRGLSAM